jgi:hypothetical protein
MKRRATRSRFLGVAGGLLLTLGCGSEEEHEAKEGAGERAEKMGPGLQAFFAAEPAEVAAGKPIALVLEIRGRPGEELRVRFDGSAGVVLKDAAGGSAADLAVRTDANGKARVEVTAIAPEPRGCQVLARVSAADGRTQVAHCLLGRPEKDKKPGLQTLPDGRKVRADKSG